MKIVRLYMFQVLDVIKKEALNFILRNWISWMCWAQETSTDAEKSSLMKPPFMASKPTSLKCLML